MPVSTYEKLPVRIQALQYTGNNMLEVLDFTKLPSIENDFLSNSLTIPTLEGEHVASVGDFIIKGVAGEFYPCKPDIFAKTYRKVD